MEIARLGKSGLKVSRVCLGTMTFGSGADEETSFQLMDRFVERGGTFLDTADQYGAGVSEDIVGRWIAARGNRDQIVLATKVFTQMGPGPNDGGLSRIHIQRGVEDSLRRLQTEVIDLYQIHHWDYASPPEETMEALNDLVRQGKVRYIGCSNLKAWHLASTWAWPRTTAGRALSAYSRSIARSTAASKTRCCPSARRRGWASSSTTRWQAAF